MPSAQIHLIRGIVIDADTAYEMEETGKFEPLHNAEVDLVFAIPSDEHNFSAGDGETAVVVGAGIGVGYGIDWALIEVVTATEFAELDRYKGTAKGKIKSLKPLKGDREIAQLIEKTLGVRVKETDIKSYAVCFYG